MSRRPAYDEGVATVVVLDNAHHSQHQHPHNQHHQHPNHASDNIYKSNLLSNDNVIAFASGVVIDDGVGASSSTNTPVAANQIPVQKSLNVGNNRFQNVSRR